MCTRLEMLKEKTGNTFQKTCWKKILKNLYNLQKKITTGVNVVIYVFYYILFVKDIQQKKIIYILANM